jgi:hypothetical protein
MKNEKEETDRYPQAENTSTGPKAKEAQGK